LTPLVAAEGIRGSPASDWLSLVLYEYVGRGGSGSQASGWKPSYASIRHALNSLEQFRRLLKTHLFS